MNNLQQQPLPLSANSRAALTPHFDLLMSPVWVLAFFMIHIPLAALMVRVPAIATFHAFVTLALGLYWAYTRKPLERVAYLGAYIVGSEVLWRMTSADVFWEFGKYATAAVFLVAIFRSGRKKGPATMFVFFGLLLPSILVLVNRIGIFEAKAYVSFFLSGPLAMMAVAWFFSRQRLSVDQIRRIFLIAAGPIIGIASITLLSIYSAQDLTFTEESNYITSGGFGPNQVSAALGLGALFALMFVLLGKTNLWMKVVMLGGMLLMAAQSSLTFSRGGLYNALGATIFTSVYLLKDKRTRRTLLFVAVIVFVLGTYVILPRLENLSGGKLTARFSDTGTTNRVQIAMDEMAVWKQFPILGAGPGGSLFVGAGTAHTEFFRLPAEHGVLGVLALLMLLVAAAQNIKKATTTKGRAIAVCLIGWSFLFMLNAAMRLVAPAFVFGLAFAIVLPETSPNLAGAVMDRVRARSKRFSLQRKFAFSRVL